MSGDIAAELTAATMVARFRELEIHLVAAREAPATMEEIGRIREREFVAVGAGRGGEMDLDRYDSQWPWYLQLVSWDPEEEQIVAMYRAIHCGWALQHGGLQALRTAELFRFSDHFRSEYLQYAVELGRSVVNRNARRALAGLFSVWTGLGALMREWTDIRYFFGNVSLYRTLPGEAVAAILGYLFAHHRGETGLVTAHRPVTLAPPPTIPGSLEELQTLAGEKGWTVPPILLSYLKAHPGMLAFDVAEDDDFGGALEVAIAVPTTGITPRTMSRFIDPYRSVNSERFNLPQSPPQGRARG